MFKDLSFESLNNERELLKRVAEGDQRAFETLYRIYRDKSLSVIQMFLKSYSEAEDILHDIFIQLWSGRKHLQNVEDFDAYLFISIRNSIMKRLLKKDRLEKDLARYHLERQHWAGSSQKPEINDVRKLVHEALLQLPEQQRKIYSLSRNEGLTHHQISGLLQISPKTVANTLSLVLNHIRAFLSQHGYVLAAIGYLLRFFKGL